MVSLYKQFIPSIPPGEEFIVSLSTGTVLAPGEAQGGNISAHALSRTDTPTTASHLHLSIIDLLGRYVCCALLSLSLTIDLCTNIVLASCRLMAMKMVSEPVFASTDARGENGGIVNTEMMPRTFPN
jgi:hypothetical protein